MRSWKLIAIIAASYAFVTFAFNPFVLFHTIKGGDDGSYLAHALTIALDGDLDYSNEPIWEYARTVAPSGHAPSHAIGAGLMAAPFVAAFSVLDRINHHPIIADHRKHAGSWSLFGFFIGAAAWFLFGIWLYLDALTKIGNKVRIWEAPLWLVAIGVPYYVLARPTMSHAFEFAAIAMVFWSAVQIAMTKGSPRVFAEMVLILGALLTGLTRLIDVNVLVLPIAVWGLLVIFGRASWPRFNLVPDLLATIVAAVAAIGVFEWISFRLYDVAIPSYVHTYGSPSPFPNGLMASAIYFVKSLPLLWTLLTSAEFGLIFSSPLFVAGAIGLPYLLWKSRRDYPKTCLAVAAASAVYFGLPLFAVFVWREAAGSYAYRYLFSLAPLCLLATTFFIERAPRNVARIFRGALLALSVWGCIGMVFFDTAPDLGPKPGITALGVTNPLTFPGFERHVAESLMRPESIVNAAAHRVPGFLAAVVITHNQSLRNWFDRSRYAQAARYMDDIKNSPVSFIGAILLFWLAYPLCFIGLTWRFRQDRVALRKTSAPAPAKMFAGNGSP